MLSCGWGKQMWSKTQTKNPKWFYCYTRGCIGKPNVDSICWLLTKLFNVVTFDSLSRVQLSEDSSGVWGRRSLPVVMASFTPATGGGSSATTCGARGSTVNDDTRERTALFRHLRWSMLKLDTALNSSVVLSLQLVHPCIWHCTVNTFNIVIQ